MTALLHHAGVEQQVVVALLGEARVDAPLKEREMRVGRERCEREPAVHEEIDL
jgi:hypothetical protein